MTRELDSRISDGIYVRLLWDSQDGRISVSVDDTRTGDAFELPVPERQRALDVFHHPYAYAARRGARVAKPGFGGDDVSLAAPGWSHSRTRTAIGVMTALSAIGALAAFALPSAAGELIHVVPVPLGAV